LAGKPITFFLHREWHRPDFLDARAELTRLYPVYISSTSNHAA
jgi:hypothetical protein